MGSEYSRRVKQAVVNEINVFRAFRASEIYGINIPLSRVSSFLDSYRFEHVRFDIISDFVIRISNLNVSKESVFHFKEKLDINFTIFGYIDG